LSLDTYFHAFEKSLRASLGDNLVELFFSLVFTYSLERCFEKEVNLAREEAEKKALREGLPSWKTLKGLILRRDKGICAVCGKKCNIGGAEIGHLQDRACGGKEAPSNLVVMCGLCNRVLKPRHESIEEARKWIETSPLDVSHEKIIDMVLFS
jgi:hypothetical protein